MEVAPVELWLRSEGPSAPPPECLLAVPVLAAPGVLGLYRLVVSSVWTPLTWGDVVNARSTSDDEAQIVSLAASGPHIRTVVTHDPEVARMRARALVHEWGSRGAVATETLPGLFVSVWAADMTEEDVRTVLTDSTQALRDWSLVELWTPAQRHPTALAPYLPRF